MASNPDFRAEKGPCRTYFNVLLITPSPIPQTMPKKGKTSKKKPSKKRGRGPKKKRKMMTLDKVKSRRGRKKKKAKRSKKKYKVPSDDEIIEAIHKVMRRDHIVRTQTDLQSQVLEVLRSMDPEYTITGFRLRKVALEKAGLTIEIQGREMEGTRAISKCPVCRSPLKATKNVTIYGGTVTLGFKCTKCPYWTGKKRRVPTRYTFYIKKR